MPTASPPRLRAAGLRNRHAGPFDLSLQAGACLAITGPSGAGKSLFLRMLADLDDHEGEAWLDGTPRAAMAGPAWRRHVRYAAAEPGWWADTVRPHFEAEPTPMLEALGLPPDILDRSVERCSTGERQRLGLARALLDAAPALLLDEPTGALDGESRDRAEALIRAQLTRGAAIVLVTHDPAQAERLGTARAEISAGRMRPL